MNKYIDMWVCPADDEDVRVCRKSHGKPTQDEGDCWSNDDPEYTYLCKKLLRQIIRPLPKKEPELWRFMARRL